MGALGGVTGVALAGGIVLAAQTLAPSVPLQVAWPYAIAALGFSGVIGIIAGIAPAARAAGLDPIEALRAE